MTWTRHTAGHSAKHLPLASTCHSTGHNCDQRYTLGYWHQGNLTHLTLAAPQIFTRSFTPLHSALGTRWLQHDVRIVTAAPGGLVPPRFTQLILQVCSKL